GENLFSSAVATDEPIVSGLAPGSCAVTSSVGKSTLGRSLTGSDRYATVPNSAIAAMSRLVAIGRLMNPSEMFIVLCSRGPTPARSHSAARLRRASLRRLARAAGAFQPRGAPPPLAGTDFAVPRPRA